MTSSPITLITGGNRGLGYETARRLAVMGHHVYIGGRDETRGTTAAQELGVDFVKLDVTDDASVQDASDTLASREGRLDVLINNAGIAGPRRAVGDLTGEDASGVLEINVVGIVRVTHAFLPLLSHSYAPVIVNVSSGMGSFAHTQDPDRVEHGVGMPLYSASKAAVTMLTTEYAKLLPGIRINAADPGYTATDFNNHRGTQTVEQGTDSIVALATLSADGPTGTYVDRDGPVAW